MEVSQAHLGFFHPLHPIFMDGAAHSWLQYKGPLGCVEQHVVSELEFFVVTVFALFTAVCFLDGLAVGD
jgi:hypothetical protein